MRVSRCFRTPGLLLLSGLLVVGFLACDEKMGPVEQVPEFAIQPVNVPTVINRNKPTSYVIQFRVIHPEGPSAVDSVWAEFTGPSGQRLLSLSLYDDGAAVHSGDGDVVAHDGVYSNRFSSQQVAWPAGPVALLAGARDADGNQVSSQAVTIAAVDNRPPEILQVQTPDTLPAGSSLILFAATVADSNGVPEDVLEVLLLGFQNGALVFQQPLPLLERISPLQARYGQAFDSTFTAGRKGAFHLQFLAVDRSGDSARSTLQSIFLENTPPQVFQPIFRDTLQRPTSGADTLSVHIRAIDRQGAEDLDRVQFVVELVGGNPSAPVLMFDDGDLQTNGDPVASDGQFSRIVSITAQNQPGTYLLHFSARDRVGQWSETLTDTLVVLP